MGHRYSCCIPARHVRKGMRGHGPASRTPLQIAVDDMVRSAGEGDMENVMAHMGRGTHPNMANSEGYTCLHVAARAGHIHVIRFVLRSPFADLNVNPQDREGWSPLHHSSKAGHLAAVRMLVQNGADPHRRSLTGITPLMIASSVGSRPVCEFLVSHDVTVLDERDAYGQTALMTACDRGHTEVVQLLLEVGADAKLRDVNGGTALHYAAGNGLIQTMRLLMRCGAVPTATDLFGNSPIDTALAQDQGPAVALLRQEVQQRAWAARAEEGRTGIATKVASTGVAGLGRRGQFGGIHVLHAVLATGATTAPEDDEEELQIALRNVGRAARGRRQL